MKRRKLSFGKKRNQTEVDDKHGKKNEQPERHNRERHLGKSKSGSSSRHLKAALRYGKAGLPVVPLHDVKDKLCTCGDPGCDQPGRHPRTKGATTKRALIEKYWSEWPNAKIGVVLGTKSGVLALATEGAASRNMLRRLVGAKRLKRTVTIIDDERRIALFRVPEGQPMRLQVLGPGLTVLAEGDVLVMPSRRSHTEAKRRFAKGQAPDDVDVIAAPKKLLLRATGEAGASPIVATQDIKVEDVLFGDRLRPVRPDNIAKLAESLNTLGQTRAITVRPDPQRDGKFKGIAGNTFFESAKSLGWTHIRADIMECTELTARLWEAVENLYRAELTALEEAEHQAACVRLIVKRDTVSRQNVVKPQGGRPEGAITKAARELPIKGKTQKARRKAIERGIKVAAIFPEAKVALTGAGLDDNRSALREIAKVETPEGQFNKVQEIVKRKAKEHAKRSLKANAHEGPSRPSCPPDDVVLAELKTYCTGEFKKTWKAASTKIRRRFLREVLNWKGGRPLRKGF